MLMDPARCVDAWLSFCNLSCTSPSYGEDRAWVDLTAPSRLVGWTVEVRTSDRRENPSPFDQLGVPGSDIIGAA